MDVAPKNWWPGSKTWLWLLGVLVVTAICYVEIPRADFVYDDGTFIVDNKTLRTMGPLSKFFTNRKAYSADGRFAIYRPLPALSYAIDYQIGYALDGMFSRANPKRTPDPTVFHVTNIMTHVVNAGLVFVLLLMLFGNAPAAALGAMLFAVHPLNIESVSWISRRGNVFFLFFALIAFCLHIRLSSRAANRKGNGYLYAGVLGCYALSLLSQELAIILPGLLLSYDLLLGSARRRKLSKLAAYYVPMIVLAALYLWGRHEVLGKTAQQGFHGDSFFITMYTMCGVFVTYLRQLFVPTGLAVNYVIPLSESLLEARVLVSLVALLTLAASAALLFKRVPLYSFCVGWFFITLAPVSNVVPLQALQNDRFLYMTTVGLSIGLAGLLAWSMSRKKRKKMARANALSIKLGIVLGLAVLTGAVMTFRHNRIWHDNFSLWSATVIVQPNSSTARSNLGNCYRIQGKPERAIAEWEIALRLGGNSHPDMYKIGLVRSEQGRHDEALKIARLAVEHAPEHYMTRFLLANVLNDMGRLSEAELVYKKALTISAREPSVKYSAHILLARIYLRRSPHGRDDVPNALKHAEAAWELHKDADVALTLVTALRVNGQINRARNLARHWRPKLAPEDPLLSGFIHELRIMGVKRTP